MNDDTEAFYTSVLLGSKDLLRKANASRLKQARGHEPQRAREPAFSRSLGSLHPAALGPLSSGSAEGPRRRLRDGDGDSAVERFSQSDGRQPDQRQSNSANGRLNALLGLGGAAGGGVSAPLAVVDAPPRQPTTLERVLPELAGETQLSIYRDRAARDAVAKRVAAKIEASHDRSRALGAGAATHDKDDKPPAAPTASAAPASKAGPWSLVGDDALSVDTSYQELPSIAHVERRLAREREKVGREAREATAALEMDVDEQGTLKLAQAAAQRKLDAASKPRSARKPKKAPATPLKTTASVYSENLAIKLEPDKLLLLAKEARRRETAGQFVQATPQMMRIAALYFRYRDETRREDAWRVFADEHALLEARARATGVAVADFVLVERHPIRRTIEALAFTEISSAVRKALRLIESKGRLFEAVAVAHSAAQAEYAETFRDVGAIYGEQPRDVVGSEDGSDSDEEGVQAVQPPPALALGPPERVLPLFECLVEGKDVFLRGTYAADGGQTVRAWVHRRRRWHAGTATWMPWRWRVTVYHLETGDVRMLTLAQAVALHCAATSEPRLLEAAKADGALAVAALAASYRAEALAAPPDGKGAALCDFKTTDYEAVALRAQDAQKRHRASLVEGCVMPGDSADRGGMTGVASQLLKLLRLETLRSADYAGAVDKVFRLAADGGNKASACAISRVLTDNLDLVEALNLPPHLFSPPAASESRPAGQALGRPAHVMRRVFVGLRGVVAKAVEAEDLIGKHKLQVALGDVPQQADVYSAPLGGAYGGGRAPGDDGGADDGGVDGALGGNSPRLEGQDVAFLDAPSGAARPEAVGSPRHAEEASVRVPTPDGEGKRARFERHLLNGGARPATSRPSTATWGAPSGRWVAENDGGLVKYNDWVAFMLKRESAARALARVCSGDATARLVLLGPQAEEMPAASLVLSELGVVDAGDGAAATRAPAVGYGGVEGGGSNDVDGAAGDGGARWEAEQDAESDLPVLSVRCSGRAGEASRVPGCAAIGSATALPKWLGDGGPKRRRVPLQRRFWTLPAGLFCRSEAKSSTDSVMLSTVTALDDPLVAPPFLAWVLEEAVSPQPWVEPWRTLIPQRCEIIAKSARLKNMRGAAGDAKAPVVRTVITAVFTGALVLVTELLDDGPSDDESPTAARVGRSGDGFRRTASETKRLFTPDSAVSFESLPAAKLGWLPREVDPETSMRTYSFGLSARHMRTDAPFFKPGVERANVWHSTQRCVELLVRPRLHADYKYVIEVTDRAETGCGASPKAEGTGPSADRLPMPQAFSSALIGVDEDTYTQGLLTMFSKTSFDANYARIDDLRKRESQRDAIRARLEAIAVTAAYHDLAARTTKRKMRAKIVRLVSEKLAAAGARGIGDSSAKWAARLSNSTCVEKSADNLGVWEQRLDNSTNATFFYNVDPLADAPRLRWDAPLGVTFKPLVSRNARGSMRARQPRRAAPQLGPPQLVRQESKGRLVTFDDDTGAALARRDVATPRSRSASQASPRSRPDSARSRPDSARSGASSSDYAATNYRGRRGMTQKQLAQEAAEQEAGEAADQLIGDAGFLDELVRRLGLANVVPRTDTKVALTHVEAEAHRSEIFAEDGDGAWWSDSCDEVGDVEDWEDDFLEATLPQSHDDVRTLALQRRRAALDSDAAFDEMRRPACVPKLGLCSTAAVSAAPAFEDDGWRGMEHHQRGRYWAQLPKMQPRADFLERPNRTHCLSGGHAAWPASVDFATPPPKLVGMHVRGPDDRSWGENRTRWAPHLGLAMFVKDPQDDVDNQTSKVQRRSDRNGRLVTTNISISEMVQLGARDLTTVDEIVTREEAAAKAAAASETPPLAELLERATFAARTGNVAALEECCDTYALPVDARDASGNTLLALAAQQNDRRCCKYLLARGADVNAPNLEGNTPVFFCFGYSYDALGKYLLGKGADDTVVNNDGQTCYEFQSGAL